MCGKRGEREEGKPKSREREKEKALRCVGRCVLRQRRDAVLAEEGPDVAATRRQDSRSAGDAEISDRRSHDR